MIAVLAIATPLLTLARRGQAQETLERRLEDQAVLVGLLLSRSQTSAPDASLDDEAGRLGRTLTARVTLIDSQGTVIGDSLLNGAELAQAGSLAQRPEIVTARSERLGLSSSEGVTAAAIRVTHPRVAFARVELPQPLWQPFLRQSAWLALLVFGAGIPLALALSWREAQRARRRIEAIAAVAQGTPRDEGTSLPVDFGHDDLASAARAVHVTVLDLEQRVRELSRDQNRMAAILAGMIEGVLVVDGTGRIQLINEAAQTMLHAGSDTAGRPYFDAIRHPEIAAQVTAALQGKSGQSREFVLPGDPDRTFVGRAGPVGGNGSGAVLVLHDITDLKHADQIRRDFVANVSHELRTPLTAIRGYTEALAESPTDLESSRRFLEIIGRQSRRMERLVQDLLRLARLDAKQEILEIAPCDIEQIFHGVVANLGPAIEENRQRVTTSIAPDAQTVEADPAKLHDIVRNLVENAVNYCPEGTEVRITATRADDAIEIIVADSGPGIPPDDLDRVFERFYRVDKSRSRPGGTGLGLSIVKHLASLHGGTARAGNASDGGARFTITLPRHHTNDRALSSTD